MKTGVMMLEIQHWHHSNKLHFTTYSNKKKDFIVSLGKYGRGLGPSSNKNDALPVIIREPALTLRPVS